MGKQTVKDKPRVLFSNVKNSNTTINTYSKTLSSISHSCTKSLIMQLKKKFPENNYYENNGVLKRDLSIETDICILRRYYKNNKNKMHNKQASSARSKYSINNDTITELKADISACGDSEPVTENTNFNVDLTSLVIDNLKTLLNDWIKKYLLENNETKQKIETVLDSILHKVELEQSSSSCTYNLDITVKKDPYQDEDSVATESDNNKISSLTIPLVGKQIKLISTLSVPRKSSNATKKIKRTRFQQSTTHKPNNLHMNSSHLNVLEITTESFTKRFATYQKHINEKAVGYHTLVSPNRPQSSRTTLSSVQYLKNNDIDLNEECLKRSLKRKSKKTLKSNTIIDKIEKSMHDQHRLHAKDSSIKDQLGKYKASEIRIQRKNDSRKYNRKKTNNRSKKLASRPKYPNIREKKFAFLYRKSCNRVTQQKEFIKHVKSVFKYFDRSEYISNIKVNIQVNVFANTDTENESSEISRMDNIRKYDEEATYLYNVKPKSVPSSEMNDDANKVTAIYSNNKLKLITLLDGAASQAKYLTSPHALDKKHNNSIESDITKRDKRTDTSGFEIKQDLGEIKTIIKDLSTLAKNIVKEHLSEKLQHKTDEVKRNLETLDVDLPNKCPVEKDSKESRGIQCSNLETKNVLTSGLKLRKGPTKQKDPKNDELNSRLTKRSTSYRIIESESILKVHDMTSAADVEDGSIEQFADKALTCSLPKSKSLFEISTGTNNKKLLAFYCDDCFKPAEIVYGAQGYIPHTSEICSFCPEPRPNYCSRQCSEELKPLVIQCNNRNCKNMAQEDTECDNDNSTESVYIEIDNPSCDKKFVIRKRSVSFKEGCFYCTLLWIPVLVIAWFFYVFTLKGLISSGDSSSSSKTEPQAMTPFPISLTDLGFK